MKLVLISVLALVLANCASTRAERFSKIQVGMYKGKVLDLIGSPVRSNFSNDEYVWVYRIYENEIPVEKEVRIKKEVVTYVGNPKTPADPFDRIKEGMDKEEVLDILGFPKGVKKESSREVWTFKNGKTLIIQGGKVTFDNAAGKESGTNDGFLPVED